MKTYENKTAFKKHTISVFQTDATMDDCPRDFCNAGKMICWHKNYILGDKDPCAYLAFENEGIVDALKSQGALVSLPVFIYEHSGIALNTGGFHCPFDSGMVGIIYATPWTLKEAGILLNNPTKPNKRETEKIKKRLKNEVEVYSKWLNGEVFGFEVLDAEGNQVDTCFGFYSEEEALNEAKGIIRALSAKQ